MPDNQPIEARCDHCKQQRPLFLYEPDHTMHFVPVPCEWCDREKQPLLCARCWEKERLREENTPAHPEELAIGEFLMPLLANNGRQHRQAESDKAACDGIAEATRAAEENAS